MKLAGQATTDISRRVVRDRRIIAGPEQTTRKPDLERDTVL